MIQYLRESALEEEIGWIDRIVSSILGRYEEEMLVGAQESEPAGLFVTPSVTTATPSNAEAK